MIHVTNKLEDLGHLHLGEETAGFVLAQSTSVADRESVRAYLNVSFYSIIVSKMLTLDRDLSRLTAVQTLHTLDLGESDIIAVFKSMSGFIEAGNNSVLILQRLNEQRFLGIRK